MKYKILLTNDDSINSLLLAPFAKVLKQYASELLIVVPATNQSACSQSIHISSPLEIKEREKIENCKTYTVSGSPADCVKIAKELLNYDFDIIVSGINDGYNLADDICYSGTVGAASEAEFYNKKGIAVSLLRGESVNEKNVINAFEYIFNNNLLNKTNLINVNIHFNPVGIKETVQGKRRFNGTYKKLENDTYIAINKHTIDENEPFYIERENEQNADFKAIENSFTSITLMSTDKTK